MQLDGVFIDMYGTLTTGDRAAVEAVAAEVVAALGLKVGAGEFAIHWGNVFFALMETANYERFLTLRQTEEQSLVATLEQYDLAGARIPSRTPMGGNAAGARIPSRTEMGGNPFPPPLQEPRTATDVRNGEDAGRDSCGSGCEKGFSHQRQAPDAHTAERRAVDPRPFIDHLVAYWRDPPLQLDAAEFVARCPVPVYVVSNADEDDLREALRRRGLGASDSAQRGRVLGAVTSEEARAYKPEPAIFEIALARTGWRRDRVLHVGDSLHSDVGGARRAGLKCAWINRAHRIHDIGTDEPDWELPDLGGLLEMLNGSDEATKRRSDEGDGAATRL